MLGHGIRRARPWGSPPRSSSRAWPRCDVYFGGHFQAISPLGVAVVAFTLCSVLFLPVALVASRASLRVQLAVSAACP
jgi:hypothetical protein